MYAVPPPPLDGASKPRHTPSRVDFLLPPILPPAVTTNENTDGELNSQQRTILSGAFAAGTLFAIAYVGYLVFEDPVYGAVAGAFSGVGTFLLFQYVLAGGLADGDSATGADGSQPQGVAESGAGGRQTGGGVHTGAAGFALDAGGVTMIAAGFATDGRLPIGILAAVAVSLVGYVVLDRMLPRPDS